MAQRKRSRDPLTAAVTTHLAPAMVEAGFRKVTARLWNRDLAAVVQFVTLDKALYGSSNFDVYYGSLPLFAPTTSYHYTHGGRLWCGPDGGERWNASDHETADRSMLEVVSIIRDSLVAYFESTTNVEGLLAHYEAMSLGHWDAPWIERAACSVRLGDEEGAREVIAASRKGDVNEIKRGRLDTLSLALDRSEALGLLDEWEASSRSALNL